MINYGIGHLAYGILNFFVALILLTFLIIALVGLVRFLNSRDWLNAPKCEKCGAPVTLQDKECPECGEATRCAAHQRRKEISFSLFISFSVIFTLFAAFGIKVTVDFFAPGNQLKEMLTHNGGAYEKKSLLASNGPYWKCDIRKSYDRARYKAIEFQGNSGYREFEVTATLQTDHQWSSGKEWIYNEPQNETTGKYSVDNDKTLTITLSDGTVERYTFDEENKRAGDTWYLSGNTLVIGAMEYEPFKR